MIRHRSAEHLNIRPLAEADHDAVVNIYNHYIEHTAFTFDLAPYTVASRQAWLTQFDGQRWQCLVAETDGQIIGYANSARFRTKAAYDPSVEVSVYVAHDARARGVGRALYAALFEALSKHQVHRAYAGITQPNDASVRLHAAFGFTHCGTFKEVGYKFERYWDVAWYEKDCS